MHKSNTIRWFFSLFIPFLFLQFFFATFVREPYPAILLPSFGDVPTDLEHLHTEEYCLFAFFTNGDSLIIKKQDLFHQVPEWHTVHILNNILAENSSEHQIKIGKYQYTIQKKYWMEEEERFMFYTKIKKRLEKITTRTDLDFLKIEKIEQIFSTSQKAFLDKKMIASKTLDFE